jgi:hypothetical protein
MQIRMGCEPRVAEFQFTELVKGESLVKYAGMQKACRVYLKWVRHGRYKSARITELQLV